MSTGFIACGLQGTEAFFLLHTLDARASQWSKNLQVEQKELCARAGLQYTAYFVVLLSPRHQAQRRANGHARRSSRRIAESKFEQQSACVPSCRRSSRQYTSSTLVLRCARINSSASWGNRACSCSHSECLKCFKCLRYLKRLKRGGQHAARPCTRRLCSSCREHSQRPVQPETSTTRWRG